VRHRILRGALPLLGALFATAPLFAQSPSPASAEVPASTLIQRLGAKDLPVAEARQIAEQFHQRPVQARIGLFDALRQNYTANLQLCEKAHEKLLKQFESAVPDTQRTLQNKLGSNRIDELRKQARSVTAREGLTKEMIHAELDPILSELRGHLLPTTAQVLAQDPELATATEALRQQVRDLDHRFDLWLESAHWLDADAEGRRHIAKAPPLVKPAPGQELDAEFARACVLAMTLSAQDRKALEFNETLRATTDPAEFAGTLELNRIRIALGLNALRIDEKLGNAARDHSKDMVNLGFFAHESPVEGKKTPYDRASRAGTSASSENIAQGHGTGEGAIEGWWYSPGHHKNMLGSHGRTGLGRHETTWTQLFGG
jgi:hypothetical protein